MCRQRDERRRNPFGLGECSIPDVIAELWNRADAGGIQAAHAECNSVLFEKELVLFYTSGQQDREPQVRNVTRETRRPGDVCLVVTSVHSTRGIQLCEPVTPTAEQQRLEVRHLPHRKLLVEDRLSELEEWESG